MLSDSSRVNPVLSISLKNLIDMEVTSILDMYLTVHGGITYAQSSATYPVPSDIKHTWIGFDCGHSRDTKETNNEAYVEAECESLAGQIVRLSISISIEG